MKALHRMDRYRKEVLQLSTRKHGINVQYLYDKNKQKIFCKKTSCYELVRELIVRFLNNYFTMFQLIQ